MAENKTQILSNLYSLRAGMSAVALEHKKVDEINNKTQEKIRNLEDDITTNLNKDIERKESRIKELNYDINRDHEYINKNKNIKPPSKAKRNLKIIRDILFPHCLSLSGIISSVILFYLYICFDNTNGLLPTAGLFLGGFSLYFFFRYIWRLPGQISVDIWHYKNQAKKYNEIKEELSSRATDIIKRNSWISESEHDISELKQRINETKNKIQQLKISGENNCTPHYQLGNIIQEQFEKQFDKFLNLRDWRSVDIIIFAFESGRVDTMREALTYADGESRTDRIVNAINVSTQAVCRSIQSGLHSLALSMGQCFSVISQQIASQTSYLKNISTGMQALAANTENLVKNSELYSENLADLAKKVDYSNALQQQSNESSAKMAEENETFLLQSRHYMNMLTTKAGL